MRRLNRVYFETKSNDENKNTCQYTDTDDHPAVILVNHAWIHRCTVVLLT